ncbi:MAG: RNA-binding protein [Verrucomicrobiae bacterium]|nr:RNA-binding protein [Verrucomicrobiae bacterium]MDW8344718.1 RNA-binding protein [Verrucomicrobiae bacterium]
MATKLFVGNLSYNTTEGDVLELFQQVGTVQTCELIVDKFTNKSRGFAFVTMGSEAEAGQAISRFNGYQLDGRSITVNEARPREERSGSFSGGRTAGRKFSRSRA